MKRSLLDILVCPLCKGCLELSVTDQDDQEIVEGKLSCGKCQVDYPIEDTIPNLLPPDMR